MQTIGIFTHEAVDINNVKEVEIFTRTSPPCHFCLQAKRLIRRYLPQVTITEYNINLNSDKWRNFLNHYTNAKMVPQIIFTMKNGARWYIGGYYELEKVFPPLLQDTVSH